MIRYSWYPYHPAPDTVHHCVDWQPKLRERDQPGGHKALPTHDPPDTRAQGRLNHHHRDHAHQGQRTQPYPPTQVVIC